MAAANTDKFKKVARKWVGQIGAGGVADDVVTTVPLAAATNLPTDTAVEVVIDRVDSNGTKTPTLEETVVGVVSGSNLISCVRGVEGTAQAHSAGSVVEVLLTADNWNDVVDGLVVEHGQDGTHDTSKVAMLAGTQTFTGAKTFTTGLLKAVDITSGSGVNTLPTSTDTLVGRTTTDTLTNKRVTKRVTTITSSATPTVNTDNCDVVTITALAEAITSMTTNLSGTPTNFQTLIFRILDDGTGRAITWGTSFQAMGVALPTTTTANKVLTVGFIYDTVDSKWGCVAVSDEA